MISLDGMDLSPEMRWVDEFGFSRAKSQPRVTLGGKTIIETSALNTDTGRPITLGGEDAWVTRDILLQLSAMAQTPGAVYTLILNDGRSFQVQFRFWEEPVLEATPVSDTAFPSEETYYRVTMRMAVI